MFNLENLTSKSDSIGALASTLCFLHCLATPFLFAAHAGLIEDHESHPWWWGTVDIIFFTVSFFAVFWSSKKASKSWVKYGLWFFWILLAIILLNEKLHLSYLAEASIYIPTVGLILLHFYNYRDRCCENSNCCTD